MLELDLLLKQFCEQQLEQLSQEQIEAFEKLLALQDPDLYHYLLMDESIPEKELAEIVAIIRTQHRT